MRRLITLILVAAMSFLLVSCGTPSNGATAQEDVQSGDEAPTQGHVQNGDTPPPSSVAVTVDNSNWSQYFEVIETPVWTENAFGEVDGVEIEWALALKAEYQGKLAISQDFHVALALRASYNLVGFSFDPTLRTYEYLAGAIPGETPVPTEKTVSFSREQVFYDEETKTVSPLLLWSSSVGVRENDGVKMNDIYHYHDIEVTRSEGVLYLYE